jgi:hypothetical protein
MLNKLFHDIVTELPIHEGRKAELHKQVDATVNEPEKETDDGSEDSRTGSANSTGSK